MGDMTTGTQLGGAAIALFIIREVFTFVKARTNGKCDPVTKEVNRLASWTGDQEGRVRQLEISQAQIGVRLDGIEREQARTATALEALTKEIRDGH